MVDTQAQSVTTLQTGHDINARILKGEKHFYQFYLKKGEYLECLLKSKEVMPAVDLLNSTGKRIKSFEMPLGGESLEFRISIQAVQTGNYRLQIYPLLNISGLPDSLRGQLAEENQGNYSITEITFYTHQEYERKYNQEKTDEADFVNWINTNAQPIKYVDAGNGFDDLQPLKEKLKDVRVIGLGEATHGTSEFFRTKHRLLEFLVKEMGYTSFYIEASMSRCRYINDYVLYGKGNLDTATAIHGFTVWRVDEVRNMIEWMREYNHSVPAEKKLKFTGYDLQVNNWGIHSLQEFYAIVNAQKLSLLAKMESQYDSIRVLIQSMNTFSESAGIYDALYKQSAELLTDMMLNEGRYKFLTDEKRYASNLENIKLITEEAASYRSPLLGNAVRDYYMAENIFYLLGREKPEAKVVVWAHNGHIAKTPGMLGGHLSTMLKNHYYAMGFEFYQGSFQTRNADINNQSSNLDIMSVGPPSHNALAWYLDKTGKDMFYIDFRSTGSDKVKNFSKSYEMHSVGSMLSKIWPAMEKTKLNKYDGLIYIKNTTAAHNFNKVIIRK